MHVLLATHTLLQYLMYVCINILLLNFICIGPSKASLLLTLLNESPSEVLGRLIFERGITPQKLESLMQGFSHLHVVEVIVKCCCPTLPSTAPSTNTSESVYILYYYAASIGVHK